MWLFWTKKNIGIKIPTEKHQQSKTYQMTCAKSEVLGIDGSMANDNSKYA
jgi:hypothetical protein